MSTELQHLAGRVWLYPYDPDPAKVQPCVAVIVGDAGSVVVDAGNSPDHAADVRRAITAAGLPAPRTLVYTHHHWDHVWGAGAWPDVEVVGHEAGRRLLEQEATRPWSDAYLRAGAAALPRLGPSFGARARAVSNWTDFVVRPPDRTFTDRLVLPGGVEVVHVGGRHAEDSTVVVVPDSGVLLLGDCVYPPPLHLRQPGDGLDVELARRLLGMGLTWYVESHGDPRRHPSAGEADDH